jgi:hypothetical protein
MFPKDYAEQLRKHKDKLIELEKHLQFILLHKLFDKEMQDIKALTGEDMEIFDMAKQLYHYGLITNEDKKELVTQLNNLLGFLKTNKDLTLNSEEKHVLENLTNGIASLVEHTANYIEYVPGVENRE